MNYVEFQNTQNVRSKLIEKCGKYDELKREFFFNILFISVIGDVLYLNLTMILP